MPFFLWVVYYVLGLIISVPYCLLAGWSWENWPVVAFVAPAFLFVWLTLGVMAGHVYLYENVRWPIGFSLRGVFKQGKHMRGTKGAFWTWTVYGLLPIIVYWSGVLISKMGYESVATMLKVHRYMSPLYVFVAMLFLLLMGGIAISVWDGLKSGWPRISRLIHR